MSEKATLIVKAANQSCVDQRIDCILGWSVLRLKEEISQLHSAKPTVQEQKLIYSGHLLQDSVSLKDSFQHPSQNNEFIIHLVYSIKTNPNSMQPPSEPVITSPSNNENSSNGNLASNVSDGVRHRVVSREEPSLAAMPQPDLGIAPSLQLPQTGFPFTPFTDPVQQMAAMQQMYAQYMTTYMQYVQLASVNSGQLLQDITPGATLLSPPQTAVSPANSELEDAPNNAAPQPLNANPADEQGGRRNAQVGVPGEEEEAVARDWLDYFYFFSRMLVLFFVVYFYSTLVRFLAVACISIFIYLYQCGRFRRRRMEDPAQPAQDPPHSPGHNNEAEEDEAEAPLDPQRESVEANSEDRPESPTREGPQPENEEELGENVAEGLSHSHHPATGDDLPPQPSLLALSWTFVTTLFTSLIPEQHQIV